MIDRFRRRSSRRGGRLDLGGGVDLAEKQRIRDLDFGVMERDEGSDPCFCFSETDCNRFSVSFSF